MPCICCATKIYQMVLLRKINYYQISPLYNHTRLIGFLLRETAVYRMMTGNEVTIFLEDESEYVVRC